MNPGARPDSSAIRGSVSRRSRLLAAISILALSGALLAACGTAATAPASSDQSAAPEPISVVATTAVLADLVHQVGGNRVSIYNLVPPGSDVHTYQITPRDNVEVSQASLIVSNGAGLFVNLDRLIQGSAAADAVQIVASDGLTPSRMTESHFPVSGHDDGDDHDNDDDDHDDDDGQARLRGDPHFWLDPRFAVHYVNQIANGLAAADPANAPEYLDNAADYISQLEALDGYISAKLPKSRQVGACWSPSTTPMDTSVPVTDSRCRRSLAATVETSPLTI